MSFDDDLASADAAVIELLGEPVTLQDSPSTINVIIEKNFELVGEVETLPFPTVLISGLKSDLAEGQQGSVFTDGSGREYTWQKVLTDDGSMMEVLCH